MRTGALVITVTLVALSGCASAGSPMATPSRSTPSSSTPSGSRPPFQTTTPLPGQSASADATVPPKRWAAIVGDLTGRGVPTDAVQLVSARSVTWNNGALGCPQPGVSYTQALVNGMQVVVEVLGKRYDYRFGNGDVPLLCTGVK